MSFLEKRKYRHISPVLIPTLILCAAVLSLPVYAIPEEEEYGLDADELFWQAEQDLDALDDLSSAEYITVSDGQDVDIVSSGLWVIEGSASDVTVSVEAEDDAEVYLFLNDLTIENRDRPCIYVGSAGKVYILPVGDTALTVREEFRKDTERKANAVIYSRTDLTLCGEALLSIESPKNGIVCRDRLRVLQGDYEITAGSKAIAADNAIWIAGGDFRLKANTDGLHAENKSDSLQGSICICGGTIGIDAGDDGIHGQTLVQIDGGRISVSADEGIESTRVLITGGTTQINASGDGINAGWKSNAFRPRIEISGGTISVFMDGDDADALDSNADLVISGGTVRISGAGIDFDGELDYSGGTVIMDGRIVREIPNTSSHGLG